MSKPIEDLRKAKTLISGVANALDNVKATKKIDDGWGLSEEFEEFIHELNEIKGAIEEIKSTRRNQSGALDNLFEIASEKTKEFFKKNYKQKKYEGSKVSAGYTVVNRKVIDGDPEDAFIEIVKKPNTKAITAYMKATSNKDNPDGKLPKGIAIKTFEYIRFKNIDNE